MSNDEKLIKYYEEMLEVYMELLADMIATARMNCECEMGVYPKKLLTIESIWKYQQIIKWLEYEIDELRGV